MLAERSESSTDRIGFEASTDPRIGTAKENPRWSMTSLEGHWMKSRPDRTLTGGNRTRERKGTDRRDKWRANRAVDLMATPVVGTAAEFDRNDLLQTTDRQQGEEAVLVFTDEKYWRVEENQVEDKSENLNDRIETHFMVTRFRYTSRIREIGRTLI